MGRLRHGGEEGAGAGGEEAAAADGQPLQWVLESKLQKSVMNFIHCP